MLVCAPFTTPEPVFGFSGTTLTSAAVAGDCTWCTAAEIGPYLAALDS